MPKLQPPWGNGPEKRDYAVGDAIKFILNGVIYEGEVRSVLESTGGNHYQVSFEGGNRTASVAELQILKWGE